MSDKKQLRLDEKMTRGVARWSAAFGLSFQHILINTGARFMPLAAGTVFAFGVYEFVHALGYAAWSAPVAAAVAIGIAAIGFKSAHTVMDAIENGRSLFVPIALFATYITIGGGSVWLTDANSGQQVFTSMVFLLDAVMYLLLGIDTVRRGQSRKEAAAMASVVDEKTAADALARARKLEDDAIEFEREEAAKAAQHKRTLEKKAQAQAQRAPVIAPHKTQAQARQPSGGSGNASASARMSEIDYARILYNAFSDGGEMRTADARELLSQDALGDNGIKARTVDKVLNFVVDEKYFVKQGRGVFYTNGRSPHAD